MMLLVVIKKKKKDEEEEEARVHLTRTVLKGGSFKDTQPDVTKGHKTGVRSQTLHRLWEYKS